MNLTKKICVIDIGSNSIRMVIYKITQNKSFIPIKDIKETVRLGEGINNKQELKIEKIKLALNTIQLFKQVCDKNGVDEIIAFGTAAIRIAKNSHLLLNSIKETTGIDVTVFKGIDEAYFSFKGAINSLDVKEGVVIDLGGSSLEIVYFKNRAIQERISLDFGSVTLSEITNLKDELNKKDENILREFIRNKFKLVNWANKIKKLPLIGVGGTVRNIGSVNIYQTNYPLKLLHNYRLSITDVKNVVNELINKNYKEKIATQGLTKARADVFIGAAIAIEEMLTFFNLKELIISGYGIREGVLYERLTEYGKIVEHPFDEGFNELLDILNVDIQAKRKQYNIFKKIYSALNKNNILGKTNEKVIKLVTHFYDIGKSVNYLSFSNHSAYMILNLGLKGIEQKEILEVALILMKGNKKNLEWESWRNLFSPVELEQIIAISKILNMTNIFYDDLLLENDDFEIDVSSDEIIFSIKCCDTEKIKLIDLFISHKKFVNIFDKKLKFKNIK